MPSIFDYLFGGSQAYNPAGGATPGINPAAPRPPSILDTPEYGRERTLDALQGLAAGLVQAGAPSPYPVDFGTTLGMAGAGIGRGMQGSEDRYLKRAMVNSQVRKNEAELARDSALNDLFKGGAAPSAPASTPPVGNGPATAAAPGDPATVIGGMESGGKYDAVGPVANGQGHRAYGKYQVLEPNVPVWTAEVLGKPMTPQEFLANPQAQDAVFKAKFGQYSAKYGPEGAAKAWFAGEGGMNNPNAKDVLGTSVAGYGQKFSAGGAPALPPQGDAVPVADGSGNPVQPAQYTPPQPGAAPPAAIPQFKTVQDVVNSIPAPVRQLAPGMTTQGKLEMLMKYADPGSTPAIDTTNGQVVFVPNNLIGKDPRYQPVKGAELAISARNAAASEAQAKAREEANRIRGANEPMQPPTIPGGAPTPTPGFAEQKGAISAAEESAKIQPKVLIYQAEQAIKDHGETQQAASKARTDLNDLKQLDTLLQGIETGKMTPATQEMKAWAKAAGFNLDTLGVKDDVANTQAASSLLNRMTLQMRNAGEGGGMPGSMSDADRAFLQKIPPGLETTKEGRRLIVDYMTRINQRTIDIARIKNQFMQSPDAARNPAAMWQKVQEFSDANPLFSDKDQLPAAAPAPGGITVDAIDAEMQRRKKGAR